MGVRIQSQEPAILPPRKALINHYIGGQVDPTDGMEICRRKEKWSFTELEMRTVQALTQLVDRSVQHLLFSHLLYKHVKIKLLRFITLYALQLKGGGRSYQIKVRLQTLGA